MIDKTYLIILKQKTKMRKILTYAVSALALASCSSDSLVSDSPANTQAPIAFNVGQKNITRSTNLEDAKHYNFGVWAYKTRTSGDPTSQLVMDNYLVGYSNETDKKGYEHSASTTWAGNIGDQDDHKSPWFYEKLGNKEYTYDGDGFYKASQTAFMSANDYQYLRYWDLAYTNTNFYAYAPYSSTGVSFSGTTLTVKKAANKAGYNDAAEHDFIYAGAQATNAEQKDVKLTFMHLGAMVKVAFRESVPGYKVKLIDVTDANTGIQATPATSATATTAATYYTESGATINFENLSKIKVDPVTTGVTPVSTNLKFAVPTTGLTEYTAKDENTTKYNVLPEAASTYATSGDVYYAVVQPATSTTGFTFHVSYTLIAEDNGETVTVRDARVFVPADQVRWASNTAYTYNFTISKVSTGTTDPNKTIDLTNPTVPTDPTVCPIVFDGATISDYTPENKNVPNN